MRTVSIRQRPCWWAIRTSRLVEPWKSASCRGLIDSFLRFQLRFVRGNEGADLVRHVQEPQPLLLVESHGKAPHAVDGDRALFADLQADAGRSTLLEGRVLA